MPKPIPRTHPDLIDGADATGSVGEVEAARQVVAVAEHLGKDLAESERHESEIVALQPQRRRADDDASNRRDEPGEDDDEPERDMDPRDRRTGCIEEVEVPISRRRRAYRSRDA